MKFDYQEFVCNIDKGLIAAEDDLSLHLLMIETLMCSVAKICKMTLDEKDFRVNSHTRAKITDLMIELAAAMLRDYLEMEKENA